MDQSGVHTKPLPTGKGWCNTVNGKIITRHRYRESAEEAGREIAKRLRIEHVIGSPDDSSPQPGG